MENKIKSYEAKTEDFGNAYNVVKNHLLTGYKGVAVIKNENGVAVCDIVRVVVGATDSTHTALINVYGLNYDGAIYTRGKGKASGYGYHRMSAAVESAFRSAGVYFENSFSGVGAGAMVDAIEAATKYAVEKTIKENEELLAIDVVSFEM